MDGTESTRSIPSRKERQRAIFGMLAFCALVVGLTLYQAQSVGAALDYEGGASELLTSLSGYSGDFLLVKHMDVPFMRPTWLTTVSYRLVISNTSGITPHPAVSVSDPVPADVTILPGTLTTVPSPPDATYDSGTRTVNWSGGLAASGKVTITYQARVNVLRASVQNTAALTDASLGAPLQSTASTSVTTAYLLYASDGGGLGSCSTAFTDISSVGTDLGITTTQGAANVTMPFHFNYYGVVSDTLRVGNQGWILFGQRSGTFAEWQCNALYTCSQCCCSHPPDMGIYPFCDSLGANFGTVYYATLGTAPHRRFIVQWDGRNIPDSNLDGNTVTFQAVLYEGSNNIDFVYQDVLVTGTQGPSYSLGKSAAVGLRNDGMYALQYWAPMWSLIYQTQETRPPRLQDGLSLCFRPIRGAYLPLTLRNY